MTSIKVHLNKSRARKDGTYPLVFQLIHQRKKRVIYSPYHLFEECFDGLKGKVVNRRHKRTPLIHEINDYIMSMLRELRETIVLLEEQEKHFSVADVVALYQSHQNNSCMVTYMDKLIRMQKEEGRIGTANAYQSTLNRVSSFLGNDVSFCFNEINVKWLNLFISSLQKSGLKANTVNFYLRILRAVYNRALKEDVAGANVQSPFRNITLGSVKTVKRALDAESIQQIANASLEDKSRLELARDFFLFSFYSRGMSFVDMAFLKYTDISNDIIYYYRSKTGQLLQIKIVTPLNLLINKYHNGGEYVLPILCSGSKSLYNQYRNGLRRYNNDLKILSTNLQLPVPLTSYVSRHSWATIAKRSGAPVSVISEGLGHSSEKITYTYLAALDPSVIDAVNEEIANSVASQPNVRP